MTTQRGYKPSENQAEWGKNTGLPAVAALLCLAIAIGIAGGFILVRFLP